MANKTYISLYDLQKQEEGEIREVRASREDVIPRRTTYARKV